jgi:hypothetical protein
LKSRVREQTIAEKYQEEVENVNSQTLLNNALAHLGELDELFSDLASRSEHQVQRSDYLGYQGQIKQMQERLSMDLDNIADTETFTMSLDKW